MVEGRILTSPRVFDNAIPASFSCGHWTAALGHRTASATALSTLMFSRILDGFRIRPSISIGPHTSRKWRNWQTHQLEGLALARAWGFESPLPHHVRKRPEKSGLSNRTRRDYFRPRQAAVPVLAWESIGRWRSSHSGTHTHQDPSRDGGRIWRATATVSWASGLLVAQ